MGGIDEQKLLFIDVGAASTGWLRGRTNDGDDDYDHAGSDNDGPAREVVVTRPPRPVRVETQTVAPGPGYVWTTGYRRWTGTSYVWVPGSWVVRARPPRFGWQATGYVVLWLGLDCRPLAVKTT
jgi:hypothetical protein